MAFVVNAIVGYGVSLVLGKVLEEVKLLAKSNNSFMGLQSLLGYLKEPTAYLENHEELAEQPLVHNWLVSIRKELDEADSLVREWQMIRSWNLIQKRILLTRLLDVTENINFLRNNTVVALASNVSNFDRLHEEVVDVKNYLEVLTAEVRTLTSVEKRGELVQATKKALARNRRATVSEAIEEIRSKALRTSGSGANVGSASGTSRSPEAVWHFTGECSPLDEVFGGNFILDNVISEILDGEDRKCIGLWAMGGAGKTFTAARVYNAPRIQNYFNGNKQRIWVTVGKRSSYLIMKEIFVQLGGYEGDFPAADNVDGVRMALRREFNLDKFLLVIDDVWEIDQLDFIDLIREPVDSKRRVILVTTRDKKILERKLATKIEVSLLDEEDSWKLFSRNAFGGVQKVPKELRDVPRLVAAECKGLPLALKVIGSTLAGETDLQMWSNSLEKLKHASVLSKEHEEQVFGRLQLSIENLRHRDSRLEHCFYYFAAYPEDAEIDARKQLVHLWTAEGIVGNDPDHALSPENQAYELLGMLIALSMIELHSTGSTRSSFTTCKIHDVMRDLARYNLETNFGRHFSITEKIPAGQRLCLFRPGMRLATFPEDWIIPQDARAATSKRFSVERLSFISNELQQLPRQFDAPHLRVLLLGQNTTLQFLPDGFFKSFESLMVLDLQETGIEEIPEAVFRLNSLVLLNLIRCKSLRQISASVKRLQNLQELRVSECGKLTAVPKGLRSLRSLKVLDTAGIYIWDDQKSSKFGIGLMRRDFATLRDVVHMTSLQSLSISSRSLSEFPEISELTALESLDLLCASLKELPGSITRLNHLKSLRLGCSSLTCLPALDELQHLENIELLGCSAMRSFPDSFGRGGAFPSLQSFHMRNSPQFDGIPILQRGAMPQIESFIIGSSYGLKELPASFQVLRSLIYLELSVCQSLETLLAFNEPNSFPYLKEINFSKSFLLRNLPEGMLKAAPDLRRLCLTATAVSRSDAPKDLLEKEELQKLEILWPQRLQLVDL